MHTETTRLSPSRVYPPHEPSMADHLDALTESMRRDGWQGRPILAFCGGEGDSIRALTGSHRIAAARAAGLDAIPVLVLSLDTDEDVSLHDELDDSLRGRGRCLTAMSVTLREADTEVPADVLALADAEEA